MAKQGLSSFIKKTSKHIKSLKSQIERLKKKQEKELEKEIHEPKKPKTKKPDELIVQFSLSSVAKATLVVLALLALSSFVQEIGEILLLFFISVLFAAALDPTVNKLEQYKIPRALSVIVMFLVLLFLLGLFISQLVPLLAIQLFEVAKSITNLVNEIASGSQTNYPFSETLQPYIDDIIGEVDKNLVLDKFKDSLESVSGELQSFAGDTLGVIITLFNGIFNFFLVLILTFFLVVDERGVDEFFISLFPSKHGKYIVEKIEAVKLKVGFWLRGQIILMLVMFVLTLIGLLILGVPYALTLAMMAGIAELLPVVGPIIAGVPAVLVAFNASPWLALWVLILYIFLQQLEGNLIVPLVMKKAVGLSPIIIILAMLIGYAGLGILGTIIAVPVATTLAIFVNDYAAKEK